jgi:Flp pilus assembly protein TadB
MLVFGGLGLAVAVLLGQLVPGRVDLAVAVARYDAARQARPGLARRAAPNRGLAVAHARLGQQVLSWLAARGYRLGAREADLELLGRPADLWAGRKALTAVYGGLLPAAAGVIAAATGTRLPAAPVLVATPVLAAGFWLLPEVDLRRAAATRRRDLVHALGCYLDLLAMSLAGGRAPAEALTAAARIGYGPAFSLLAETIASARLAGHTPWAALGELGARTGVPELRDLAAAFTLVADDGARIRESVSARAATLRRRQLSDTEGRAGSADQGMHAAQVILAFGFLLLILYPAAQQVLAF